MYLLFVCSLLWYPVRSEYVPGYHNLHNGRETARSFDNEWTVEVVGGEEVAQLVALELGYKYGGPVLGLPNMYAFHTYVHKQRRTPSRHTSTLHKDRRIQWAEQLFAKSRVKRYPIPDYDRILNRVKRIDEYTGDAGTMKSSRNRHGENDLFNDELWGYEWYLQDTRDSLDLPRLDLNVLPVYALGYNGEGVRVSILDDGVEHNHTDLRNNYDPEISWDCNDGDSDPSPRHDDKNRNSHGTRCAGEIAMTANNKKCGVGVAWGAKVGGVRMLDGRITDHIEGKAIGYAWDKVDIYSASWGPNDDGKTVEGPGRLALEALKRGVEKGRNGKGSIYVWANGNGGIHDDNCNCDGYSSSIYTISIGSASQQGLFPWYGEICPSTLATAYSSGAYRDQKIATTDVNNSCTLAHTGTSAAAPLAAGIIALMLHANPNLTWRDVQHLIVWTSEYTPLSENPGWQINGAGLYFDIRFGFGLLNAASLVNAALNWTTVPNKLTCHIEASPEVDLLQQHCLILYVSLVNDSLTFDRRWNFENTDFNHQLRMTDGVMVMFSAYSSNYVGSFKTVAFDRAINSLNEKEKELISTSEATEITIPVSDCAVNYIEHVELIVNIEYTRRGALEIYLLSPQGTKVQILSSRPRDTSKAGFVNWPLTSVASWGESANGLWKIIVQDQTEERNTGEIDKMVLIIHGTAKTPNHMKNGPRRYDNKYSKYSKYQQLLDYIDSEEYDEDVPFLPELHSTEEVPDELTTTILEMEKELLRNHHSKSYNMPLAY